MGGGRGAARRAVRSVGGRGYWRRPTLSQVRPAGSGITRVDSRRCDGSRSCAADVGAVAELPELAPAPAPGAEILREAARVVGNRSADRDECESTAHLDRNGAAVQR